MLEWLTALDREMFFLINREWVNGLSDLLLPLARNKYIWAPLYMFIAIFLLVNYKRDGIMVILYLILTVFITDQLSSSIIKPFFERLRPCKDLVMMEHVRLLIKCGSGYSFTSSHAMNHFGVAFFLGIILWRLSRWVLPVAFLWAAIVSYAQVYVGVHYPFDVIGGGLIGLLIGSIMAFLCKRNSTI